MNEATTESSDITESSALTRVKVIRQVADKLDAKSSDVETVIEAFLNEVTLALRAGQRVEFRGFGVFTVKTRKARVGRNPKHPERGPVNIPARQVIRFKPGKELTQQCPLGKPVAAVVAQPV